jgi:hypothetical protein
MVSRYIKFGTILAGVCAGRRSRKCAKSYTRQILYVVFKIMLCSGALPPLTLRLEPFVHNITC